MTGREGLPLLCCVAESFLWLFNARPLVAAAPARGSNSFVFEQLRLVPRKCVSLIGGWKLPPRGSGKAVGPDPLRTATSTSTMLKGACCTNSRPNPSCVRTNPAEFSGDRLPRDSGLSSRQQLQVWKSLALTTTARSSANNLDRALARETARGFAHIQGSAAIAKIDPLQGRPRLIPLAIFVSFNSRPPW